MKKKFIKAFIVPIAAVAVYLYLANGYIYYKIGASGVRACDKQYTYTLGEKSATAEPLIYAALGDSFTAGTGTDKYEDSYPYLVAQELAGDREVTLKDFAIPGGRTSTLIANLLEPAITADPDIVTVLIGTNDMHGKVSVEDFEKNYKYIIENLQKRTHAKIYLVSVPFAGSDKLFLPPYNYYFQRKTLEFNETILRLSQAYGVGYIDIATPTEKTFTKAGPHYSADSFHPSAAGYKLWAQIIYDNIHQPSD